MLAFLQRNGSFIFLYMIAFLFTAVIAYQMIQNIVPNALAVGIVNIVIGYAINSQGVQHGVAATNDTVAKTAVAQAPLMQAQESRTVATETQLAANSARLAALEQTTPQETP